ncbi:MAG: flagellar hook-associated protein FlgK [Vicinamibacterales bacterium]
MSGLFDNLTSASRSLRAHQLGIEVAGENLANLNTPGYSRKTLDLAEVPPTDYYRAGRGVDVVQIRSVRDEFIEARLRREGQGASRDNAVVDGLSAFEASIGPAGRSLDAKLNGLFDAFSSLASDVTSVPLRDQAVRSADDLAQAFRYYAGQVDVSRRDADGTIRASVGEINQLAQQVATLNKQIAAGAAASQTLIDQRGVALSRLSELADIGVVTRPDGAVDVTIGHGRGLVVGETAYDLGIVNSSPGAWATLTVAGSDVTSEITGGQIGGLLHVRDTLLPAYGASLDQLAYDVATAVNAAHGAGYDGTGAPAGNLFVPPGAVAGAAAAFAVDPGVLADSQLVAGSSTGTAGDNGAARALAALRDANITTGGTATAEEAWGQIVFRTGTDIAVARSSAQSRGQVVDQLQRLRDQASGVSLDEEAADLIRYQRAYQANARYFQTIVDTLDTLLQLGA